MSSSVTGRIRTASGATPLISPARESMRRHTTLVHWHGADHWRTHLASSKKTEREAREARDRVRRFAARQAVHEGQTKRRVRDNLIAAGGILVIAALATTTQVFYFTAGPGDADTCAVDIGQRRATRRCQRRRCARPLARGGPHLDRHTDPQRRAARHLARRRPSRRRRSRPSSAGPSRATTWARRATAWS